MVGVLFVFPARRFSPTTVTTQLSPRISRPVPSRRNVAAAHEDLLRAAAAARDRCDKWRPEEASTADAGGKSYFSAQNELCGNRLAEAATAAMERELRIASKCAVPATAHGLDVASIRLMLDQQSGCLSDSAICDRPQHSWIRVRKAYRVRVLAEVASTLPCFTQGAERHDCGSGDLPILGVAGRRDTQISSPYPNLTAAQSQRKTVFPPPARSRCFAGCARNPSWTSLRNGQSAVARRVRL